MDNEPINPWLGQVTLDFRQNKCDDEQLRKGYMEYINKGSTYYRWSDYVSRCALQSYAQEHPVLLMPRSLMPLPQHTRDVLNHLMVNCVADLIQFTVEELDESFSDKEELKLIIQFLENNNLHICSHKRYTYKLSIESVDRVIECANKKLLDEIESEGLTQPNYFDRITDDNKYISYFQSNKIISFFRNVESFAEDKDCSIETLVSMYRSFERSLLFGIPYYKKASEYALYAADRLVYYLKIMEAPIDMMAQGYREYADVLLIAKKYSLALEQYKNELELLPKIKNPNGDEIYDCYNQMGVCYHRQKEHEKALKCCQKALKLLEKNVYDYDWFGANSIYRNLASIYSSLGDKKRAKECRSQIDKYYYYNPNFPF